MKKYYQILGVTPGVTQEQIHAAFRRLAKEYHPDAGTPHASAEKFRLVKEAFEALKNEEDRRRFELNERVLDQIERFHALAMTREEEMKQVANGGPSGAIGPAFRKAKSQGLAQIIPFPEKQTPAKEKKVANKDIAGTVVNLFQKVIAPLKDTAEQLSDIQHRNTTRKMNRIPASEIGLRVEG